MGLIGTRSIDQPCPASTNWSTRAEQRIGSGMQAYAAMQLLRAATATTPRAACASSTRTRRISATRCCCNATPTIRPGHAPPDRAGGRAAPCRTCRCCSGRSASWSACGLYFIALFASSFWLASKRQLDAIAGILSSRCCSLPLPWIAAELGWIVAEYGRQPWAIDGRAADLPRRLGHGRASVVVALRLRDLLYRAGGGRRDADDQVRSAAARTGWVLAAAEETHERMFDYATPARDLVAAPRHAADRLCDHGRL